MTLEFKIISTLVMNNKKEVFFDFNETQHDENSAMWELKFLIGIPNGKSRSRKSRDSSRIIGITNGKFRSRISRDSFRIPKNRDF